MARIRTIKPEFWTDEDMAEVSEAACLLAIGLLNYADDEGYFNANPKLIKAAVFPIREPSRSIPVMLQELSKQGYLTLFSTSDSRHFGVISNFAKHQVVNKPRASKIKVLNLLPYDYGNDTGELPLGMDQGSGKGKVNPSLCARENFVDGAEGNTGPDPSVINSILENRAPPAGGLGSFGKFVMHPDWKPEPDFFRKAAMWGVIISEYTPVELAEFVTYWQAEGKVFHQAQWEQKFSQSIKHVRAKKSGGTDGQKAPNTSGKSRAVQTIEAAIAIDRARNGIQPMGGDGGSVLRPMGDEEWIGTVIDMENGSIET
ncbi:MULTISPECIES: DnaT-like ssDNA-binding domain-containing protein [Yersinia]|uniref:Primosomal protein I n=1 Tax=Yersinia frederiksenii TaxID=29484 RepID=A0AAI8ZN40_YERFR|nr:MULTISPECIES: DnaT-like ssDNA-binding domain-containing protein [Yersinia]MDN0126882.1 DnaT-like ssDNA-binding domain-containing protein [Yersinia massiliensis]CFQ87830.1 Primosomal protein I [Yersinia frederiksenii]